MELATEGRRYGLESGSLLLPTCQYGGCERKVFFMVCGQASWWSTECSQEEPWLFNMFSTNLLFQICSLSPVTELLIQHCGCCEREMSSLDASCKPGEAPQPLIGSLSLWEKSRGTGGPSFSLTLSCLGRGIMLAKSSFPLTHTNAFKFTYFVLQQSAGTSPLEIWTSTKVLYSIGDCPSQGCRCSWSTAKRGWNNSQYLVGVTASTGVFLPITWCVGGKDSFQVLLHWHFCSWIDNKFCCCKKNITRDISCSLTPDCYCDSWGIMIHSHGMLSSIIIVLCFFFIIILFTPFLLLAYMTSFQVKYLVWGSKTCVYIAALYIPPPLAPC